MRLLAALLALSYAVVFAQSEATPGTLAASRRTVPASGVYDDHRAGREGGLTRHVLALDDTESFRAEAERAGRIYLADDSLCDATGFRFVAGNNLGLYEMGDTIPMLPNTRISVEASCPASFRLFLDDGLVHEAAGARFDFTPTQPGAYRVEASLEIDGAARPWIRSGVIRLATPAANALQLPSSAISPEVEAHRDIPYADGKPEDAAKHKLDVFVPKGRKNFAVFFFVHGGAWRTGDRSRYAALGNRFAREGLGVVIPSYRLSPASLHPAHIEDVAAAFAWTAKNIAGHGGDATRIYIGGHSAGGHLSALLALDPRYLERHGLSSKNIRGVIPMSGVYEVDLLVNVFGADAEVRRQASPMQHVKAPAPPFIVTYCQWDYPFLPAQAKAFHAALRKAGVRSELVYVPGESHISEIVNIVKDGDLTARTVLRFVK